MPSWYDGTKFFAQVKIISKALEILRDFPLKMLCSVNSAINPFITFRKTFAQMYRQFRAKQQRKRIANQLKLRHLHVYPKPSKEESVEMEQQSAERENVIPTFGRTQILPLRNVDQCECEKRRRLSVVDEEPTADHQPPLDSGLVEDKCCNSISTACLTKHVLMKYRPQIFLYPEQ